MFLDELPDAKNLFSVIAKEKILVKLFFILTLTASMPLMGESLAFDQASPSQKLIVLPSLPKGVPFSSFPLVVSTQQRRIIALIKINTHKEYNNYGNLNALKPEMTEYFQSLGNSKSLSASMAAIMEKQIRNLLSQLNEETAWVSVRASKKTR